MTPELRPDPPRGSQNMPATPRQGAPAQQGGGLDFAALLSGTPTQARTAPAGGRSDRNDQPAPNPDRGDASSPAPEGATPARPQTPAVTERGGQPASEPAAEATAVAPQDQPAAMTTRPPTVPVAQPTTIPADPSKVAPETKAGIDASTAGGQTTVTTAQAAQAAAQALVGEEVAPATPTAPAPATPAASSAPPATPSAASQQAPAAPTATERQPSAPAVAEEQAPADAPPGTDTQATGQDGEPAHGDSGRGGSQSDGKRPQAQAAPPAAGQPQQAQAQSTAARPDQPAAPRAAAPTAAPASAPVPEPATAQPATPATSTAPVAEPAVAERPIGGTQSLANEQPAARAQRLGAAVETTIRLAQSRNATQARIQLRPIELGSVEVVLRHTARGLSAAVRAESPEAAQALAQAQAELRRSLESSGVNIVSIEVTAGDGGRADGSSGQQGDGDRPAFEAGRRADETEIKVSHEPEPVLVLDDGSLVDVLA